MKYLHDAFGDVKSFLENEDLPPSCLKLLEILNDPPKNRKLQMELAITIDADEQFVKATYHLEGDGPLLFTAYEEISTLQAGISNEHYPNTNAVAIKLSSDRNPQRQQLLDYAKVCVRPAYKYFHQKFDNDLKMAVSIFKYARFFDPGKICELKSSCADVDNLQVIPDLNSQVALDGLKSELPNYMAIADGIFMHTDNDKLLW